MEGTMNGQQNKKIVEGEYGYILEDVPHLTDYIPSLPVYIFLSPFFLLHLIYYGLSSKESVYGTDETHPNPLQDNPAYAVVAQYFVDMDDSIPTKIVVHKDSKRGLHFRRAGPRQKVSSSLFLEGLNTVIREIVCGLYHMYGVNRVIGIDGGYKGFYAKNTIKLDPKVVNDIHKRGGTILGTSRGGHDTKKIVDSIQDRGINQVYIIGGDGTQKGAAAIYEEVRRRGLKVIVAGIPKTIDNDIPVIDRSFGFDTAVEEAQRAINAAHVEAESSENCVGLVKLMGRYSGFIAMYATLASRDVDCCLIPESPFYLEGKGGLFEYMEKRLKENGHMVIVIAEGAGQELLTESLDEKDASGNKLLKDVGLWMSHKIKVRVGISLCAYNIRFLMRVFKTLSQEGTKLLHKSSIYEHFAKQKKMSINLKPYIYDRAIPSNAADNVYCTLLAQSAVHGAMAGFTGFTVGLVNGRQNLHSFPGGSSIQYFRCILRITETRNQVVITDRMWARLLRRPISQVFCKQKKLLKPEKSSRLHEPFE
ncbi:hypothetical protein Cgig2_027924 [Carnegiea gigantea]|uniref:Phosphofructokinase domain-containing protein n=1 Tax=Carnegiea gigantea TaxID=171969 RepID=A0A9Q1QKB5_9CARY|nr:hypothetical protein Cgig2_027924 [Carnegiea gigantea]